MSGGQFGIVNKKAINANLNDAIVCYEIFKFINNNEGMRFKKEYTKGTNRFGETVYFMTYSFDDQVNN